MFPKGGVFVCDKCGFEKEKTGSAVVVEKHVEKETVLLDREKIDVLPKTRVECPRCGHSEAFWILRQMRSSDEPETMIYTCTKCEHRWRSR
jgi:DNA-directed RNA polymerase subunit M